MKTPNYILTQDHKFGAFSDSKVIPKGTFVRPIDDKYVPKHCFESANAKSYNKDTEVFVYCRLGILPVPRKIIREI